MKGVLATSGHSRGDGGSKTHETGRKTFLASAADLHHCWDNRRSEKDGGRGEEKRSHSVKQGILRRNDTAF